MSEEVECEVGIGQKEGIRPLGERRILKIVISEFKNG